MYSHSGRFCSTLLHVAPPLLHLASYVEKQRVCSTAPPAPPPYRGGRWRWSSFVQSRWSRKTRLFTWALIDLVNSYDGCRIRFPVQLASRNNGTPRDLKLVLWHIGQLHKITCSGQDVKLCMFVIEEFVALLIFVDLYFAVDRVRVHAVTPLACTGHYVTTTVAIKRVPVPPPRLEGGGEPLHSCLRNFFTATSSIWSALLTY
jgi:hypothetical protein